MPKVVEGHKKIWNCPRSRENCFRHHKYCFQCEVQKNIYSSKALVILYVYKIFQNLTSKVDVVDLDNKSLLPIPYKE